MVDSITISVSRVRHIGDPLSVYALSILEILPKGNDGWCIMPKPDEMEKMYGLRRSTYKTARRRLRELGVLEEKLTGQPIHVAFRLDRDRLTELN